MGILYSDGEWEVPSLYFSLPCSRAPVWEGNGTPLQYSCLENPKDEGAWCAAVHGVSRSWIRLSDFTFTFYFHTLEKKMGTHSSVLAWRVPGMGEPGGLLSIGSHRVRHDWCDSAAAEHQCHLEGVSIILDTKTSCTDIIWSKKINCLLLIFLKPFFWKKILIFCLVTPLLWVLKSFV